MSKLEELTVGSVVEGILPGEPITVVSTRWYGSASMTRRLAHGKRTFKNWRV